jgi:hypothetical protein
MAHRFDSGVRRTIATVTVLLAAGVIGCDRTAIPVIWEASGTEVTRLEMPLDDEGNMFIVAEYALEGREDSGDGARLFRDRLLFSTHHLGLEGQVFGYITRTYDRGQARTFRLYGMARRVARHSQAMVVIGWAQTLGPSGAGALPFMAWVELRLYTASGRMLAKGSSYAPQEISYAPADSRANTTLPKSRPIR